MASVDQVYSSTTVPETKSRNCFTVPNEFLGKPRCLIKLVEVLLSFVAFILEEVVTNCASCGSLYFFEFVSCAAFLFTALLLFLLTTKWHTRVGINCWSTLDFWYTAVVLGLFLFASIFFAADNGGTDLEKAAVAFGILSSIAFAVDIGIFIKLEGLPFRDQTVIRNRDSNSGPAEVEKLNTEE
ncbi:CKLF-like MARVEL transmembrane domain-containing protein 6 [Osmerus eperlanus]|uniref:CKLF-like MARVEL transmembrane domain-containing protein 6 n=1 Tax=Osmerus eperlanus TaxID=29151 RepID=UPI002E166C4D